MFYLESNSVKRATAKNKRRKLAAEMILKRNQDIAPFSKS